MAGPNSSTRPGKIDKIVLMQLVNQGKGTAEIAKFFNCSHNAVMISRRRLEKRAILAPQQVEIRAELNQDNIDTLAQLAKINQTIMEELARARRLITREDLAVQERERAEDALKADPDNFLLKKKLADMLNVNHNAILKIQASVIDISAEVRKQIELQIKIAEALYSATAMAQFQEEVLGAIGRVSIPLRDAIIRELKQLRTLRGLVQVKK